MPQETILSPGVLPIENDQSFIPQQPILVGAAIIGPAVKGKVGIPTIVTSYADYMNKFGSTFTSGSQTYTYFTSISAYNYFNNGGTSLLVTRVVSGSFTPATSSQILNADSNNDFILETLSEGTIMNSTSAQNPDGTLPSGSDDNFRWQIVSPDTASGTFSLLIRKGNDSTVSPSVLETWTNLSLDPFSTNYIEKVIGNQYEEVTSDGDGGYYVQINGNYPNLSRYVRVKQVNTPTPIYLDNSGNPKSTFTGSIPTVASGTFGSAVGSLLPTGATGKYYEQISNNNIQGISASEYAQSISLLSNKDEYRYKFITTPGLIYDGTDYASHITQISSLASNCQNNGNSLYIVDVAGYGENPSVPTTNAVGIDNSYVTTYWPWVQTVDPNTAQNVWVPASVVIPGVYSRNDSISFPWFAPAGTNRGALTNVIRAERYLTQNLRDDLYQANVNPIATFPNAGPIVFGQKTLQKKASALDRVNVRRLLIELKNNIGQTADNFVFEQNTIATRNNLLLQINPYLSTVQQQQGLYAFRVVCDDSNNTSTTIDNNQLIVDIYIQPTKTTEYIYLRFNVSATGASFA